MLQTMLVFAALLGFAAAAASQNAYVAARLADQRIARAYAALALTAATANELSYVQEEVRKSGPDALSMPVPADPPPSGAFDACSADPIGAEGGAQRCRFAVLVNAAFVASTRSAQGPSLARDVQAQHGFERRVSVEIEVAVTPSGSASTGSAIVRQSRFVTLRTFANAPFASVTGVRDIGSTLAASGAGQGDSAGSNASAAGYRDASDTAVHLQLDCKQGFNARGRTGTPPVTAGPSLEGLPGGKGWAVEPPCDLPRESVDDFQTQRWNAGSEDASGWSR
jgi:hypothetical protein